MLVCYKHILRVFILLLFLLSCNNSINIINDLSISSRTLSNFETTKHNNNNKKAIWEWERYKNFIKYNAIFFFPKLCHFKRPTHLYIYIIKSIVCCINLLLLLLFSSVVVSSNYNNHIVLDGMHGAGCYI